jgi:hypothetical protein
MGDLYRAGATLDYPVGGSGAVIDALVRGIERHGGSVRLRTHVERINVDKSGHAVGVTLRGGEVPRQGQIGLQPPSQRVAASVTKGCSLRHKGLQPPPQRVAASVTKGCSLRHIGLQPPSHRVVAFTPGAARCHSVVKRCPSWQGPS